MKKVVRKKSFLKTDYLSISVLTFLSLIPTLLYLTYTEPEVPLISVLSTQRAAISDFDSSLVGYWKLDEGSGSVASDSKGSYNGTLSGGPSWVSGKVGGGVSFDGNSYIEIPNSSGLLLSPISISLNIKPTLGETRRIIDNGSNFILRNYSNGSLQLITSDFYGSKGKLVENEWNHVVVTLGPTQSIYINGMLDSTFNTQYSYQGGSKISIAGSQDLFKGLVDDVRIYNKVLSSDEVSDIYVSTYGSSPPVNNNPPSTPIAENPTQPTQPTEPTNPSNPTSNFISPGNTIYYVDFDNGSDSNQGTLQNLPWKHAPGDSLATGYPKYITLSSGDTVMFKGGVIYRGSINIRNGGSSSGRVTYRGDGWGSQKAIIDGSEPINGWNRCSSQSMCANNPNWQNIYYSNISIPNFLDTFPSLSLNVHQNDVALPVAQYPDAINAMYPVNTNFLKTPPSQVTSTSITDSRLSQYGSELIGKYIYIWINPNVTTSRKITGFNSSTNTLSFQNTETYKDKDTLWAIVNVPSVLSKAGEYYVDEVGSRMYLWPLNNQNISQDGEVTISKRAIGFSIDNASSVNVQGFEIRKQTGDSYADATGGIRWSSSASGNNITISNNEFWGIQPEGIGIISLFNISNLIIKNNSLHDTGGGGRGIEAGTNNVNILDNTIKNVGGTGIYIPGCQNCSISDNVVVDGAASHANGISVYSGAKNVVVSNNYVRNYNSAFTMEFSSGLNIYNNLFEGGAEENYVMASWGGMTGVNNIFNNTIINSINHCSLALTDSKTGNYNLKNNILDGGGMEETNRGNNLYTNLCWWQDKRYNWSLQTGEFVPTNKNIFKNSPSGDYHLVSGSPAIGVGSNLSSSFTKDLDGKSRPLSGAWSIGAYEYSTSNIPPPVIIPPVIPPVVIPSPIPSPVVPPADTTKPSISITLPLPNSTVKDTLNIVVGASDNIGVTGVEMRVDNTLISDDLVLPYTVSFDTKILTNGSHIIKAIARDEAGNISTASVDIMVDNYIAPLPTPDTTPPSIPFDIKAEANNKTAKIVLTWSKVDGATGYEIYRNNIKIDSTISTSYTDRSVKENTLYVYQIKSYDSSNNYSPLSQTITVTTPIYPKPIPKPVITTPTTTLLPTTPIFSTEPTVQHSPSIFYFFKPKPTVTNSTNPDLQIPENVDAPTYTPTDLKEAFVEVIKGFFQDLYERVMRGVRKMGIIKV